MQTKKAHSVVSTLAVAAGIIAFAAPSAFAYDDDIGWVTNSYFKATASGTSGEYINGAWSGDNLPTIADSKFTVDSTGTVFTVTKDGITSTRKVVKIDCDIDFASFYYLDDITNDVLSAIAALSLVTNETSAANAHWMGLKTGDTWVDLTGADPLLGATATRVELDYTTAAQPLVRYSVKVAGASDYVVLKDSNDNSWFNTAASAPNMKDVCFVGKADLTKIDAKLSTTAAAEVNETDYATVLAAIGAAGDKTIVLYQDETISPSQLKAQAGKAFTFYTESSKAVTISDPDWKVSDAKGVKVTKDGSTITVSELKDLVAKIGTGDDPAAYLTLSEAFAAATDGQTVVALLDFADNATLDTSKSVALDLAEFAVTASDASKPIIKVDGSSAKLFVYGGAITGATDTAAISAANGATVTIDELIATNNLKAIAAAGTSTVVISNGLFAGSFEGSDDNAVIKLLGGYILAKDAEEFSYSRVSATGGKFTTKAQTSAGSASLADGYKFAPFAVNFETNGYVIAYEVMTNSTDSATADTKVWSVADDSGEKSIGGVQIADTWISGNTTGGTAAEQQADLNNAASYSAKGGGTMKKWEAYVLGMSSTETSAGPVVKGVQNSSGNITFKIVSPDAIRAKESGCDVKFSVQEFTNPELTEGAGTESAKVDYDKTVEITPNSDGVRYYKLKMHITPKK